MQVVELKDRTKQFGLRVIKLVRALPRTVDGKAVGGQLVRSGTSDGANYRAACRARSKAEFNAKIGIVLEEADESCYWLEIAIESGMLKSNRVQPLLDEANQLTAIFTQTLKTARQRTKKSEI